jgi:hypothetical protein
LRVVQALRVVGGDAGAPSRPPQNDQPPMRPAIDRALIEGDRLSTLSAAGVLQSDLATLADRAWVPFG